MKKRPKPDETIDKLWDLLEKNPNEKGASLTALQWLLNNYGYDDKGQKGRARVLDLLIKDHADDPKIASVLNGLSNMPSAKAEELLARPGQEPRQRSKGQGLPQPGQVPKECCSKWSDISRQIPRRANGWNPFWARKPS